MKNNKLNKQTLTTGDDFRLHKSAFDPNTVDKNKRINLQTKNNSGIDEKVVITATKNINTLDTIYLKPLEACALLRIALSTLYNWVHERRLPYIKHGRLLLFRRDLLIEWSEKQAVLPLEPNMLDIRRRG